ncbi:hypothetical protein D3C71_1871520 [compost metagenome]
MLESLKADRDRRERTVLQQLPDLFRTRHAFGQLGPDPDSSLGYFGAHNGTDWLVMLVGKQQRQRQGIGSPFRHDDIAYAVFSARGGPTLDPPAILTL